MTAKLAETRTGGRPATTGTIAGDFALSVGMPDQPPVEGWQWTRITDVARLETGHTPSRKHPEYWGGDVPWIGIKDVTRNHGRTIHDTIQHTNAQGIANSSARILPENTVCLSRTASVGYVVVMGRPMATSQDFVNWVCSPHLDHRFLKYVLLSEHSAFLRFASGTTHQTIYFPEVKAFHICLPPPAEQGAIGHILQTLDDKIELNRRMSATLKAMAGTLFKAWFVDFEPVRLKADGRDPGLPPHLDALFPDRLVGTEHEDIPEGWRFGPVSDFAHLKGGKQLEKDRFAEDGPVPVFGGAGVMGHANEHNAEGYVISVGRVGAYCGQFFAHRGKAWINNNASLISQLDGVPGEWLLLSLRNLDMDLIKKGAAQPFVSNSDLAVMPIVAPPSLVLTAFHKLAEPLFRREEMVHSETENLTAVRDTLLPKLISGELRVKDAETFLDRVQ